jgi:hypothetical protein
MREINDPRAIFGSRFFANPLATKPEAGEISVLMETPTVPDNSRDKPGSAGKRPVTSEPEFAGEPKPIGEFAARPDFPQCARGEFVDIGGYTGVVIEVTNQSMRVRSAERITQSFNIHVLRRLYSPRQQPEPENRTESEPSPSPVETEKAPPEISKPTPERDVITQPDFTKALAPISRFAGRSDFPRCALGEFVDIAGFSGVVIEIVNQSLKVKTPQGLTRSYGVGTLRTLYGRR